MKFIHPQKCRRGDKISIIAPSGQIQDPHLFWKGVSILREMGFDPQFPENLWPGHMYLSDTDKNRITEFNTSFVNDDTSCVIAARGGYGAVRIVPHLHFPSIGKQPKPFFGFSDITVITTHFFKNQFISFHGPVITQLPKLDRESIDRFYTCLTGNWHHPVDIPDMELLKDGKKSEGILFGGNLTTLASMLGTDLDTNYDNCILFLEEINEPLYKVDRMLTQLFLNGKLNALKGLIMGDFSNESLTTRNQHLNYIENIWKRILELTLPFQYPIIGGFPIGHGTFNHTLPIGAAARLEPSIKQLVFY